MISQKPKVLFDAHNLGKQAGGIETYNRNLTGSLELKKKVNLILYVNHSYPKKENCHIPLLDNGLYRLFIGFQKAIVNYSPDIIHCNNFLPIPAPKKIKKVVMVHDLCFLKEKRVATRFLLSKILLYSLQNADRIIANSNFTKKQIVNFVKSPSVKSKIEVINLGVDPVLKPLTTGQALNFIKEKYRINYDFILFSGNITERKNIALLMELSKYLLSKKGPVKILISGKRLSKKGKMPKNIDFLGYVPLNHLNYLYHASLGLVFPSTCEGFGLPIIEASKIRTPVICSDIPVFREITKDTVLFAKGKNQWFKHLNTVIQGKYPLRLKEKAYKNSLNYTWRKTARKTLLVYQDLLSK